MLAREACPVVGNPALSCGFGSADVHRRTMRNNQAHLAF